MLVLLARIEAKHTDRPIIGVLTIPISPAMMPVSQQSLFPVGSFGYISASYVKYLEGSGARVVPILHNSTDQQILELLGKVNGVMFTGGDDVPPGDPYYHAVRVIVQYVLSQKKSKRDSMLPLWGTCLGLESIVREIAQDFNVLGHFKAENISLPLKFTKYVRGSTLFSPSRHGASYVKRLLHLKNITLNNHEWGISPKDVRSNSRLNATFITIATSTDIEGKEFAAILEGRTQPIWLTQFHPEKPMYEWDPNENIPHSAPTRNSMQYIGNFFVDQARMSGSRSFFSFEEENSHLIFNYQTIFTGKINGFPFEEVYVF